jgi:hypothetical protein
MATQFRDDRWWDEPEEDMRLDVQLARWRRRQLGVPLRVPGEDRWLQGAALPPGYWHIWARGLWA